MKRRDHPGRVADAPDVVQMCARGTGRVTARRDHLARSRRGGGQPVEERLGIPDGRGETEALDLTSRQTAHALQDREQVPAAIVAGEGVQLVDDDGLEIPEEHAGLGSGSRRA